jgi:hypothetical protein
MGRSSKMVGAKSFKQFIGEASTKFFALIGDNVQWGPKTAVPFVENGMSNSVGLVAQNKLFNTVTGFEGSKEIGVNALVRFSGLRQAGEQGRRRTVICEAELTSVAGLQVGSDVSIHAGPVKTLQKAFFGFVDAIMTDELISMCVGECLLFKLGW